MADSSIPPNQPASTASSTGSVFVGRRREMAQLRAALDDALAGRGRLVMLVGEPGIGKTRTALELATLAENQGAQVLWGRCYEGEGALPYWPWVQPMRAYVQQAGAEQLTSEMGPGAADIAEIVPELRSKLPDLKTPPTLEPEQARFRLFDSITTFLKNAAQRQPLMLVLDDLHWADQSSLLLLEFLAREIGNSRLLLVGAYRDVEVSRRHPLSQTLGALVREQLFHRVQLDGLTQQEVGELVEGSAGITLTLEAAEVIHRRTDGNPFFVGEVTRQVTPDNIPEDQGWASIIPEGVRDAIGRRLNRLSDQCNQMLTTASIIGREFDFRLLNSLMGDTAEDQLLAVMDEAVGAHLIDDAPQSVGLYQFTHALVRETLLEELSITRRVRLHARTAEVLEELYGVNADAHAAELAHHFGQAEAVLGSEKLVHYSLLAGERALDARAYEAALVHVQRGLVARGVALTGTDPAKDGEAAALLSCLGQAQHGTLSRFSGIEVLANLTRAFDYYVGAGDVERAVGIAAYHIPTNTGRELIEKVLELVPPDSHDAGRLLSRYISPLRSEYDRAQEAVHGALAIARQQQDLELEMRTLVSAACVDFSYCRFEQSLERNLQAIQLARQVDQPFDEAHARYDLMHVLYAMGDLEEAGRHASAMLEPAERSGNRQRQANAMDANQNVCSARGEWQASRNFTEQGLALTPGDPSLLGCRALVEYQVGDFEAGETYLEQLLDVQQRQSELRLAFNIVGAWTGPIVVIPLAARITGVTDRFDMVEATARSIISSPSVYSSAPQAARIGLALIAIQRGDGEAARDLYGALEPLRGTAFPQTPVAPGVATDRVLGLLSQTMGEFDIAASHFEDALAFCRKAGYRPELAWTCHDYAEALNQRNGPDDRTKAITLLDEALAISTELGMRPLMERVVALQERFPLQPDRAPAYPDGLTVREVEVLRHVAAGKTDREIAHELVISFRTVGNHVRSILNKTSVVNRTEAATYAARNDLL